MPTLFETYAPKRNSRRKLNKVTDEQLFEVHQPKNTIKSKTKTPAATMPINDRQQSALFRLFGCDVVREPISIGNFIIIVLLIVLLIVSISK